MKVFVKARAGARVEKIERRDQPRLIEVEQRENERGRKMGEERIEFVIWVREPAVGGRANEAIGRALAKYSGVAPSAVTLVFGTSSKNKIFEIK